MTDNERAEFDAIAGRPDMADLAANQIAVMSPLASTFFALGVFLAPATLATGVTSWAFTSDPLWGLFGVVACLASVVVAGVASSRAKNPR